MVIIPSFIVFRVDRETMRCTFLCAKRNSRMPVILMVVVLVLTVLRIMIINFIFKVL